MQTAARAVYRVHPGRVPAVILSSQRVLATLGTTRRVAEGEESALPAVVGDGAREREVGGGVQLEVGGKVVGGLTHGNEGRGGEERVFFGEGATGGGGGEERREDFPAIHGEMTTSAFCGMHGCRVVVEER